MGHSQDNWPGIFQQINVVEKESVTAVVDYMTLEFSQINRMCNPHLNKAICLCIHRMKEKEAGNLIIAICLTVS